MGECSVFAVFRRGIIHCIVRVLFLRDMDLLTVEKQAELKKCNTERLRAKLLESATVDNATVQSMDREALLDAVARLHMPAAAAAIVPSKPIDIWLRELELRE